MQKLVINPTRGAKAAAAPRLPIGSRERPTRDLPEVVARIPERSQRVLIKF